MSNLQQIIAGLQIIAKYDERGYDVAAEHDVLYAGAKSASRMSEEDKQAMKDAGWGWNQEIDSFYIFV